MAESHFDVLESMSNYYSTNFSPALQHEGCLQHDSGITAQSRELGTDLPDAELCEEGSVSVTPEITWTRGVAALEAATRHHDAAVWPSDLSWFRLLIDHIFTDHDSIVVGSATRGGATVVMVLEESRRLSGRVQSLQAVQNYYTTDFRPLCSRPASDALIGDLVESLVAQRSPDMICLSPLDAGSTETEALRQAFRQAGWWLREQRAFVNWRHELSATDDFASYLAARSSRVRNTLQRKRKRLLALEDVHIDIFTGKDANLEESIAAFQAVYARSWKEPEPYPEFIPALIRQAALSGQLRLGICSLAERPVAVHFWLVHGTVASIYKLAHDSDYDVHSPGTVLMGAMLEHVIDVDRVRRIDFLSGDDAYKGDWMTEQREKIVVSAFNPDTLGGRLEYARTVWARPLLARMMQALRRLARERPRAL